MNQVTPEPFNKIKGIEAALVLLGAAHFQHEQQAHRNQAGAVRAKVEALFDAINYAESMLFAYDRDGSRPEDFKSGIPQKNEDDPKEIRAELRRQSRESRGALAQLLGSLNEPELLRKQNSEPLMSWKDRVDYYLNHKKAQ